MHTDSAHSTWPSFSPARNFLSKFRKQKVAVIALVVVGVIVLIGLIAPFIVPYDPDKPVVAQYQEKGIQFDHLYTDQVTAWLLFSDGSRTELSSEENIYAESANRRVAAVRTSGDRLVITAVNAGETYVTASYGELTSALRVVVSKGGRDNPQLALIQAGLDHHLGQGDSGEIVVSGLLSDGSAVNGREEIVTLVRAMSELHSGQDMTGGWGENKEEDVSLDFKSLTPESALVTPQGQVTVLTEGRARILISLGDFSTVLVIDTREQIPFPVGLIFDRAEVSLVDIYKHQRPSGRHWFGTDHQNRDIFSRVLVGTRQTLWIGFVSVAIGASLGTIFGLLAGYYGGIMDNLLCRGCDVLLAFPGNLLAIAVIAMLGPGLTNIIFAVAVYTVPIFLRLVRGNTLALKNMTYVEAAQSVGVHDLVIIARHIFPGTLSVVMVYLTMRIGMAILIGASLSFLGLGGDISAPEWGAMLSSAKDNSRNFLHTTFFPGLAIVITVLSFNLLGDGLRDALDPKLKD